MVPSSRPPPGCDLPAAVALGRRSGHLHRLATRPGAGGPSPSPSPIPAPFPQAPSPALPGPGPPAGDAPCAAEAAGAARITSGPFLHRAATCPVAKQWSLFLWRLQRLLLIAEAPRRRSIARFCSVRLKERTRRPYPLPSLPLHPLQQPLALEYGIRFSQSAGRLDSWGPEVLPLRPHLPLSRRAP